LNLASPYNPPERQKLSEKEIQGRFEEVGSPYTSHSGPALARRLAEQGYRILRADQIGKEAEVLGLGRSGRDSLLHRLERSGWLLRLRRGLYALPPFAIHGSPLHEFEIAMALASPAAVSHWSALSFHGLTEQVPREVSVLTTTQHDRPRQALVLGVRYRLVRVPPELFFGLRNEWLGDARIQITDLERTLIDCLERPDLCGGFGEVLQAFASAAFRLELPRLARYGLRFSAATARRLGWILEEHLGLRSEELEALRSVCSRGYRPLDPTSPRRGRCNRRWEIQENLGR